MLFNDGATSTAFVDSNGWNIVTANASVDSAGALPKYTISNNKIVDQISVITAVGATINVFKIKLPDVKIFSKGNTTTSAALKKRWILLDSINFGIRINPGISLESSCNSK